MNPLDDTPNDADDNSNQALRTRVYEKYVSSGLPAVATEKLDLIKSRSAWMEHIIREHLPKNRDACIIDIGCGFGAFVHFAQKAGYNNIIGVDRSPEQVSTALECGISNVVEGDLMKTLEAMPPDSQDVVVALDVIEHFTKPELVKLIDEVQRVLKPKGYWIIHAPNGESPFFGAVLYGDSTHELAFTRTSLRQLLTSSGFDSVSCYEDRPLGRNIRGVFRRIIWLVVRSLLRIYLAAETGDGNRNRILSQNLLAVAIKS
jgi:2-polyprenyl-3-methyl-5-hydroxy-6-metoxy-1,4-benzoquinol methylase